MDRKSSMLHVMSWPLNVTLGRGTRDERENEDEELRFRTRFKDCVPVSRLSRG